MCIQMCSILLIPCKVTSYKLKIDFTFSSVRGWYETDGLAVSTSNLLLIVIHLRFTSVFQGYNFMISQQPILLPVSALTFTIMVHFINAIYLILCYNLSGMLIFKVVLKADEGHCDDTRDLFSWDLSSMRARWYRGNEEKKQWYKCWVLHWAAGV